MRKGWAALLAAAVLLLLPVPATAGSGDDPEAMQARAFVVRYRPLTDAAEVISGVLTPDGTVTLQRRLRTLVVQDRTEALDRVAEVLKSFDLPPRNVEVTVSLFLGTDRRREEAGREALPGEIAREVRGIRETLDFTRWTAYEPLGRRAVTGMEGARVSTDLSDDYRVEYVVDTVDEERGVVRFHDFTLLRRIHTVGGEERTTRLYRADIVLPTGRLLLVGAAQAPESSRALFLALQANPR